MPALRQALLCLCLLSESEKAGRDFVMQRYSSALDFSSPLG